MLAAVSTAGLAWKRSLEPTSTGISRAPIRVKDWKRELAFDRRVGPASAPIRLAVWTDYQCPACQQMEREFAKLRSRLGDSLTIAYRYYPLPSHKLAFDAAVVAECAQQRGKFDTMHNALFATRLHGDSLPLDSLAVATGIMTANELRGCMAQSSVRSVVQRDLDQAQALGFQGTPYLQIGDHLTLGGMPAEQLEKLLRAAAR